MTFLNFDEEMKRAGSAPAFANGFEGQSWMAYWCGNCRFSVNIDDGCDLIGVAMNGKTPYMWERYRDSSLQWAYLCHAYRPRVVSDDNTAPLVPPPPPM